MYEFLSKKMALTLASTAVFLGFASIPFLASAGTYRIVLDECKKKTGFGETACKSLVKNNLNIESCMKRAGLSEKECAKRIEEIKNDPEFTGKPASTSAVTVPPKTDSRSITLPTSSIRNDDIVGRIRSKKEADLIELGKHTEKIIEFLRSKGVDTTPIESHFPEFEKKIQNVLSAYDTYRAAYIGTLKDSGSVRETVRSDARATVVLARDEMIEFYRKNILNPIRMARDQMQ